MFIPLSDDGEVCHFHWIYHFLEFLNFGISTSWVSLNVFRTQERKTESLFTKLCHRLHTSGVAVKTSIGWQCVKILVHNSGGNKSIFWAINAGWVASRACFFIFFGSGNISRCTVLATRAIFFGLGFMSGSTNWIVASGGRDFKKSIVFWDLNELNLALTRRALSVVTRIVLFFATLLW